MVSSRSALKSLRNRATFSSANDPSRPAGVSGGAGIDAAVEAVAAPLLWRR
jgi:hypothetical protein